MLGDAYQEGTDKALSMLASKPLDPVAHEPKFSAWSVVPRGIVAAGAEISANLNDIAGAYGKSVAAYGAPSASPLGQSDAERSQSDQVRKQIEGGDPLFRDASSATAYGFASDLRPDPVTAGAAENVVFGLTKGLTKAIGAAVALGPLGGGAIFGTSEGMTTAEDLAAQGVDQATRMKVGATTGITSAIALSIPVAGKTIAQTVGLALAGGPAYFFAQQEASRKILEHANYGEIAQQYDPLDPVGLTVATLLPAGFGAFAMRGYKGAKNGTFKASDAPVDSVAQAKPADAATAQDAAAVPTPDQVDAVMTHNLTLQGDIAVAKGVAELQAADVPRGANLSELDRNIESRMVDKVAKDYPAAVQEYNALPDSQGGKVLNVDTARELSPDYSTSRESRSLLSSAVHEPASYFIKRIYADKLAEMPSGGTVMFTSGGTGAGKSTAINNVQSVKGAMDQAHIVYDTNMNGFSSAQQKIDQALNAGAKVEIAHVQRDPVEALVNGALPRASRMGRAVPLSAHEATHVGSADTIVKLADHYKNDPRVTIRVLDNTQGGGGAKETKIDFVKGFDYNNLRERLVSSLQKEYQDGSINEAIYQGTLGYPAESGVVRAAADARVSDGLSAGDKSGAANTDAGRGKARQTSPELGARQGNTGSIVPSHSDTLIRSVLDRAENLKVSKPDMPVAVREDGTHATVAQEIEAIRAEALNGTETKLGALDADLLRVAADCFLATGMMV